MDEAGFWKLEESFWTGGEDFYAETLDPACLMVFPAMGAIDAAAAVEGLRQAPRWRSVEMTDRHLARPADEIAVLAYRALGRRDEGSPYRAWCGSTYRRDGERWRLIQHQQTPA